MKYTNPECQLCIDRSSEDRKYDLSERVAVIPAGLTGRIIDNSLLINGEKAYILLMDDENSTDDGRYCVRESEIRRMEGK